MEQGKITTWSKCPFCGLSLTIDTSKPTASYGYEYKGKIFCSNRHATLWDMLDNPIKGKRSTTRYKL